MEADEPGGKDGRRPRLIETCQRNVALRLELVTQGVRRVFNLRHRGAAHTRKDA